MLFMIVSTSQSAGEDIELQPTLPRSYDSSLPDAEQLIPASHRHLGIIRLFLPYEYKEARGEPPKLVRWSELEVARSGTPRLKANAEFLDYLMPALPEYRGRFTHKDDDSGAPGHELAQALKEYTKPLGILHGYHWSELDAAPKSSDRVQIFGDDYDHYSFNGTEITSEKRLPQFVVDEQGKFAWGANLFPDSLIIAAPGYICDQMSADPRLDTALVSKAIPAGRTPSDSKPSSKARQPTSDNGIVLELGFEEFSQVFRYLKPFMVGRPSSGQKLAFGVHLRAHSGRLLATAHNGEACAQVVVNTEYVDPELDLFLPQRSVQKIYRRVQSQDKVTEQFVTCYVQKPSTMGSAYRSIGMFSVAFSEQPSAGLEEWLDPLVERVSLQEVEYPSQDHLFLFGNSSESQLTADIPVQYKKIINQIFNTKWRRDYTVVIASEGCPYPRTIMVFEGNFRICVPYNLLLSD